MVIYVSRIPRIHILPPPVVGEDRGGGRLSIDDPTRIPTFPHRGGRSPFDDLLVLRDLCRSQWGGIRRRGAGGPPSGPSGPPYGRDSRERVEVGLWNFYAALGGARRRRRKRFGIDLLQPRGRRRPVEARRKDLCAGLDGGRPP